MSVGQWTCQVLNSSYTWIPAIESSGKFEAAISCIFALTPSALASSPSGVLTFSITPDAWYNGAYDGVNDVAEWEWAVYEAPEPTSGYVWGTDPASYGPCVAYDNGTYDRSGVWSPSVTVPSGTIVGGVYLSMDRPAVT